MYKWKGHNSGVTCLTIVKGTGSAPSSIISTAKDNRARVWSTTGQYLGTLRDRREYP